VLARQEFIEQLSLWETEDEKDDLKKVPIPDACFENDRNRLREFLISWSSLSAKKQSWYTPGMTLGEELWGHFYTADIDRDLSLDSGEMMEYLKRNKTEKGAHEDKNNQMRQLCLAELIQEGDNDDDDKLDFEEFRVIMQDEYLPSSQVCDFNGVKFSDGAERAIECNGCVCACGKWICTSKICTEGYRDIENNDLEDEESDSGDSEASAGPGQVSINTGGKVRKRTGAKEARANLKKQQKKKPAKANNSKNKDTRKANQEIKEWLS